ncbi:MAG TPA: response regulator [Ferrovibrio sp.]|uniref:response regulator n=1 Tax=Ferrovibrio sp. TaxID=1917215 RepID=UPI002ED04608
MMAQILLVEDEILLRDSLQLMLQTAGHSVVTAENGARALDQAARHDGFDVVITDILMPETDGLEAIMLLRRNSRNVRIVAISGGGRTRNMDLLEYAKSFGADAVLAKPFRPDQLLAAIDRVLGSVM